MRLTRVTFTGADESVDPTDLIPISIKYPWVEWGILFSEKHQGLPRYPGKPWLDKLHHTAATYSAVHLCAHLCGSLVRDLVQKLDFRFFSQDPMINFQRVQLNFHGEPHSIHVGLNHKLSMMPSTQFIMQVDGTNDDAVKKLAEMQGPVVPLFDLSGGAGIVPEFWPQAWSHIYCGYAGGLGPDNVLDELKRMDLPSMDQPIWIDMERRVRSEDDSRFDLEKVVQVCEQVAPFMAYR